MQFGRVSPLTTNLEFDLVNNALDFLVSAVEHSLKDDARSLKYAVLHLDASIELLLKSRLAKEHWSLIFDVPDKANTNSMKTGDFISVDIKSALKRLEGIAGIVMGDDTKKRILALRDLRNRIQHFSINVRAEAVKSLLAFGCNFVLNFCHQELSYEDSAKQETIGEIKESLLDFQEFVKERIKYIEQEINAANHVTWCPDCNQVALTFGEGKAPTCLFCAESKNTRAVAELVVGEGEVWTCPECSEEGLTLMVIDNEEAEYICVFCGTKGDFHKCPSCGQMYLGDSGICDDCYQTRVNKDD